LLELTPEEAFIAPQISARTGVLSLARHLAIGSQLPRTLTAQWSLRLIVVVTFGPRRIQEQRGLRDGLVVKSTTGRPSLQVVMAQSWSPLLPMEVETGSFTRRQIVVFPGAATVLRRETTISRVSHRVAMERI
jgi:hypothetical protein